MLDDPARRPGNTAGFFGFIQVRMERQAGSTGRAPQPAKPDGGEPSGGAPDPVRWLEEHGDALYAYARFRLRHAESAEDAVQETLLAAIGAAQRFEGRSSERTWLIGILRHKVLRILEHRRRDAAQTLEDAGDWPFERGFWKTRQRAPAPMEDGELRAALVQALDQLPDRMREVVVLREIDGLGDEEICKILNLTRTNLWTLVHRAKVRLRALLSEMREREGTQ